MIEYLSNQYIIALFTTIICLGIIYIYDKFEKKQYTTAIYFRFAILLYLCSYLTFYLSTFVNTTFNIQQGGTITTPDITNIPKTPVFESFKTGIPTF